MAVGISCANTGMQSALDLLEPLQADSVDFVRQGALIATSLILMQQPEPKVGSLGPFFLLCEHMVRSLIQTRVAVLYSDASRMHKSSKAAAKSSSALKVGRNPFSFFIAEEIPSWEAHGL